MTNKVIFVISLVSMCGAVVVDSHGKVAADEMVSKLVHPPRIQSHLNSPDKPHPWYKYGVYSYPKYEFEYAVSDPHTGDHKRHKESRDGDHVQGEYSLVEPDGSLRRVQYSADDHTGFNAVVSKAMHKHGDNAFSFAGHTRHFLPVGYGQKSTYYTHTSQESHKNHKQSDMITLYPNIENVFKIPEGMKLIKVEGPKPVTDDIEMGVKMVIAAPNSENKAMVDNSAVVKAMEIPIETKSVNLPVMTGAVDKPNLPQITMQDVMAYLMASQPKDESAPEMKTPVKMEVNTNDLSMDTTLQDLTKEPPKLDVIAPKESENPEQISDSNAASSYYHSHVYYPVY